MRPCCTLWAPRLHTGGRVQTEPPGCTRGADWGPRMHTWQLFSRVSQSQERTELLELRKAIGIQVNDCSVYNSFQRISNGCHGRAERGAILLETCIISLSLDRAVGLQPSYLCLQSSCTNSTNLGAVVSLT